MVLDSQEELKCLDMAGALLVFVEQTKCAMFDQGVFDFGNAPVGGDSSGVVFGWYACKINLNFIVSYSNLHLSPLFFFPSQVTGLFWLVMSPDRVTVPEFFDSALAVRNPDRPHRSGFLHFSALPVVSLLFSFPCCINIIYLTLIAEIFCTYCFVVLSKSPTYNFFE